MKKTTLPDAWDDDWENLADKDVAPPASLAPAESTKKPSSKVTKAQRRAQQAEFNRQLWEDAEAPKTFHFLDTRPSATVPLKSDFKPPPVLLSRKPASKPRPPTNGLAGMSLQQEESSDSDSGKEKALTMEERKVKAAREREEKQKKYEEVRERLFGASTNASSGASTPGEVTPPRAGTPNNRGGRGKGKGLSNANRGEGRPAPAKGIQKQVVDPQKQLFDPNYTARPESSYLKREQYLAAEPKPVEPIRAPKGPDGSGRGGFGFASRGGKES